MTTLNLNKKSDDSKKLLNNLKNKISDKGNIVKEKLEQKGIKFQVLSRFFNMKKAMEEADEFIADVSGRHDIPHDPRIPQDLRDKNGSWMLTKNGYPVSGQVFREDVTVGSRSPILPILLVGWVVLLPFMSMLGSVGKLLSVFYIICLYMYFGFWATALMVGLIVTPTFLLGYLGPIANLFKQVSPISLTTLLGLLPAILPMIYWYKTNKSRANELMVQGSAFKGFAMNSIKTGFNKARWSQAKNAIKDKSAFVSIGKSTGSFSSTGDSFAPDAGLDFGLTTDDLSKHMLILGSTGTGKTSAGLRPFIKGIVDEEKNS